MPLVQPSGDAGAIIEILRDVTTIFGVEQVLMRDAEQLSSRVDDLRGQLTELQEAQATVMQTEKLASIGSLAAGIAHEIHTPLAAIVSNTSLLKHRFAALDEALAGTGEGSAKAVQTLERELPVLRQILDLDALATERIRLLVRSLRLFAHLDGAESEHVDPHEGIDAAIALLSYETRGRITVIKDYGPIPPLLCRPDAMNQVYMNLLQNAVQAIDGTGTIRVVTRLESDGRVAIAFHDTGRGIPPQNLKKIFEAGFTTRGRGIGTGLGLAIVYRTITSHNGQIDVDSEVDKGSVFTLRLPVS